VRYGSNFPSPATGNSGTASTTSARPATACAAHLRPRGRRANRTFFVKRSRLTLFAEVLNVLGRDNVRQAEPSVNRRTRVATGLLEDLFPVLPSVGLLVEF